VLLLYPCSRGGESASSRSLVPSVLPSDAGVGHMVHMPAHIYIRVGRYNDAAASNVHAIHTDDVHRGSEAGVRVLAGLLSHNIHFLAFASTMAGRSAQAIEAARTLKSKVNLDVARQVAMLQEMMPYYVLTLTTFGRWDDVLAEPLHPLTSACRSPWRTTRVESPMLRRDSRPRRERRSTR